MHCDSSYAVLLVAAIEQKLVIAAYRLGSSEPGAACTTAKDA